MFFSTNMQKVFAKMWKSLNNFNLCLCNLTFRTEGNRTSEIDSDFTSSFAINIEENSGGSSDLAQSNHQSEHQEEENPEEEEYSSISQLKTDVFKRTSAKKEVYNSAYFITLARTL